MEQTTEFVGTVKSRRSTTVQPQVEGFVTRILVRSGDRVRPGTPLMQIDPRMQQAAVASLESQRTSREADLRYARQEAARMKTLLEAGASSQSELEQAQTALVHRPGPARGGRGAGSRAARGPRLPPGELAHRRGGGRRPGAGGRQRHALDRPHDHRPERRPRGLHQRAGPGGRSSLQGRACPSTSSTTRAGPRHRDAVVRVAVGRRARRSPSWPRRRSSRRAACGPISSSARGSCGRRRPASPSRSWPLNRVNGQYFAFVARERRGRSDGGAPAGRGAWAPWSATTTS